MNIYWDKSSRKIVRSTTDITEIVDSKLVVRDSEPISVAFMTATGVTNTPYTPGALAAGESKIILAIKKTRDGAYLGYSDALTPTGEGAALRYGGTLNLNTQEAIAALAADDSIECTGELTVLLSDGSHRYSTQFSIKIYKDIIRGETPLPISGGGLAMRFITNSSGHKGVQIYNEDGVLLHEFYPAGV